MTINVLHIRDTGDMLGAENVIIELAKNARTMGVNPIIGILSSPDEQTTKLALAAQQHNIVSILIPCKGKLDLSTVKFLKKYISNNNINLVHSHGYKEDIYAWLSRSTPLIGTNHLWKKTTLALKLYAYIDTKILKKFNHIVAVSNPIKQDMINAGISSSSISIIKNGINIAKFNQKNTLMHKQELKTILQLPNNKTIIGMISSLSIEKGHYDAINAFAEITKKHPDIHLLIVGDGPEKNKLITQAQNLALIEHITFAGSRTDIPDLLSIIDIFLLYSTIEGLPIALLEAMASQKAIVATDVGDVSTAIIDNNTGLLLKERKQSHLTLAISRLLESPSLQQNLGRNAANTANQMFSSQAMAEEYTALYRANLQ